MNLSVRGKVWFEVNGRFAIGEGGLDLLYQIAESESLTHAARVVGWSYRHAWGYLQNAQRALGVTLVERKNGKGRNRGTILTRAGGALLKELASAREEFARTAGRLETTIAFR